MPEGGESRKLRILWICGSRIVGGAERTTLQIAELLRRRGHTVEVLCPPQSALDPHLQAADLPTRRGVLGKPLDCRAYGTIRQALQEARPDIALVTSIHEWIWACLAKSSGPHTPLVPVRHMALPPSWRVRWLANRKADAVIAVSEAVRNCLVGRVGIRPALLHVIYNPSRFPVRARVPTPEDRRNARRALGLEDGGRWVGFFGGLIPAKGIRHVLEAVRSANTSLGCTRLLACGRQRSAAEGRATADWVRELQLEGRFFYLGEIERVDEALTAVDVTLLATHRALGEAMPLTIIESMACGTPVAAYAVGGVPEALGVGAGAGLLLEPERPDELARALVELLGDPERRRELATNALQRARTLFDPERAADLYEQLFLRLRQ